MIGFFTTLLLGAYMTIMATPEPAHTCCKVQAERFHEVAARIVRNTEAAPSWLRIIHEPALDATMQISTVLNRFHS